MRLLKIGSSANCDIVLHSNKVSSLHAELTVLNNGDILLEDKNSLNGTFIMNKPIRPANPVTVKRGDAIRFADVELLWDQVPIPEDNSSYKGVYGIGTDFRNEIKVSGSTVSRFHATLKIDKRGKAFIQDHSMNGTTLNGNRIATGQNIPVKRSDSIVCGGVPIDLRQYMHSPVLSTVLKVAASVAAILAIVFGGYVLYNRVSKPSLGALEQATVWVYGSYYVDVILEDDPFVGLLPDWPSRWSFGQDGKNIRLRTSSNDVQPLEFQGTAFFISEFGELGTNRHIAAPWLYLSKQEENSIRQQLEMSLGGNRFLSELLVAAIEEGIFSEKYARALYDRFLKSPIKEITGHFNYLGVIPSGRTYSTISDFLACQVIAESGDEKKDVALLRLLSKETPKYIVDGGCFDITKAVTDESSFMMQEELLVIGYPRGETIAHSTSNATEFLATTSRAYISKRPDDNEFQIQAVGQPGQSGSPVINRKHNLVGVLCSGFGGTDVTFCCNIKHLVELYNKNKNRK